MRIDTPRATLRARSEADVEPLAAPWSDADVALYMGGARHPAVVTDQIRGALAAPPRPLDLWPVRARETGALVGHCGLLEKAVDGSREVELVYRDDAFRALRLPRRIALIDPNLSGATEGSRV